MSTTREPISMTDIVRYSGASGDFNPLHHDSEFAARAGYDRVVVMGSLSGGWAAHHLSPPWAGGPRTISVAYKRPVMLGDRLVLHDRPGGVDVLREDTRVTTVEVEEAVEVEDVDEAALVPPYPFVVEAGAVREFRRAIWAEDAGRAEVPVTFPVSVTRWRPDGGSSVRDLGFDYRRMLHARSVFRYADGPLRVGERLEVTEHHGPRSTRQRSTGEVLQVGTALWTFWDGPTVRAQLAYEMVELPARSAS
jgi:3-hydroxybutyryl-CoA dehydratase